MSHSLKMPESNSGHERAFLKTKFSPNRVERKVNTTAFVPHYWEWVIYLCKREYTLERKISMLSCCLTQSSKGRKTLIFIVHSSMATNCREQQRYLCVGFRSMTINLACGMICWMRWAVWYSGRDWFTNVFLHNCCVSHNVDALPSPATTTT